MEARSGVGHGLLPGRLLISFRDACVALGCGRTRVWELVERGELVAVGKGRARRITAASVRDYVARETEAALRERDAS